MKYFGYLGGCVIISIPVALFCFSVFAADITLPSGWNKPTEDDLKSDWRKKDAAQYAVASGDFNGDGVLDQAMLLISKKRNELGLFVFLANKDHAFDVLKLNAIKDASMVDVMGIEKVPAGKYKTACGKGYWDCKKAEPPDIVLEHDALNYFKAESANSYFYWNERKRNFNRAWISD